MTLLIDEVAPVERATLRTLNEELASIETKIAELQQCDKNDPAFDDAVHDVREFGRAREILQGKMRRTADTIAVARAEARRQADAELRAELKPLYKDLLKMLAAARDARRKILAKVEQHVDRTGSIAIDGVPFSILEVVDEAAVALKRDGVI